MKRLLPFLLLILSLCVVYNSLSQPTNSTLGNQSLNLSLNSTLPPANLSRNYVHDQDHDGYCVLGYNITNASIDCPNELGSVGSDCNDNNSLIHPAATELCNTIDDNCNGLVDEGFDEDADGFFAGNCIGYSKLDCDDFNPSVNPSKQEIIGNNVDDDCNTSTPDRIRFQVYTDKSIYNLGDSGALIINATPNSFVYITLTTPNPSKNSLLSFAGPYPIVRQIPYMRRFGNYTIDSVVEYKNYSNSSRSKFIVLNTLAATINSAGNVQKGEQFTLSAASSGGFSPFSFYWDFGDGSQAAGQNANHIYSVTGSFTVTLTVNDSEKNTVTVSKTIDVKEKYSVSVYVTNISGYLPGATVYLNSLQRQSDSNGLAYFSAVDPGTYTLKVVDSHYDQHLENMSVSANLSNTIQLTKDDISAPSVALTSPSNDLLLSPGQITLAFSVSDSSSVDCVLYTSSDNSWWTTGPVIQDVTSDATKYFYFQSPDSGSIYWKVRCEDTDGNAQFSDVWRFNIEGVHSSSTGPAVQQAQPQDEQPAQIEQTTEVNTLIGQIDSIITHLNSLGEKEQSVIGILRIIDNLTGLRKQIQNYDRDIFNVKYRKVNNSELARLTQEIKDKFEQNKKAIISNVSVTDSNSFVKYTSRQEINSFMNEVAKLNKSLPSFDEASLAALQRLATVSTKVYVVKLDYLEGTSISITLIDKTVELSNLSQVKSVIEVVPKEIASSAGSLHIQGLYSVLADDPILEFTPNKTMSITYYVEKVLPVGSAENTMTVLAGSSRESSSLITGFAISGIISGATDGPLYLIVLIVFLGLTTCTAYFWPDIRRILPWKRDEKLQKVEALNTKLSVALKNHDLDSAKAAYAEIEKSFTLLSKEAAARIKPRLVLAFGQIREEELSEVVAKVDLYCKDGDFVKARMHYEKLLPIYSSLPKLQKERALSKCLELHKRLNEK